MRLPLPRMRRARLAAASVTLFGSSLLGAYRAAAGFPEFATVLLFLAGVAFTFSGFIGFLKPDSTFLGLEFVHDDVPRWLVVGLGGTGALVWAVVLL